MPIDLLLTAGAVPSETESTTPRADLACLAILSMLWIVMAALVNPIGDFPLNDDWVYGLAVKSILDLGEFRMPSPASTDLLPQAYWGALFCLPFGFSFTALRISTLVLGLVGVLATYGAVRQLGARTSIALLAAAGVAASPLYFALANTFMTDVPFVAVSTASLFFFVKWTFDPRARFVVAGMLLAMIALLIRQAGIAIPLGFAVAYLVVRGFRFRTAAIALAPVIAGVVLHFGFQLWLQHTGRTPFLGEPPLLDSIFRNLESGFRVPLRFFVFIAYAALFSLPLLTVVAVRTWGRSNSSERRTSVVVFVVAGAVSVAGWYALRRPMPFVENVLNDFGVGPLTLTDHFFLGLNRPVVPPWLKGFWYAVTMATIVGVSLFASVVVRGVRMLEREALSSATVAAMMIIGGACVVYMILGALALRFFFDRYVLFVVVSAPLLVAFLAKGPSSRSASPAVIVVLVAALALEAAFSIVVTRDYIAWNRTRWVATSELLASGIPRPSIDGGYEFNGWLGFDPTYRAPPGKSLWWVVRDDYSIASGPVPGFTVLRSYPVSTLLPGRDRRIFVLRRDNP